MKSPNRFATTIRIAGLVALVAAGAAAAQQRLYKWVDESGVVHYDTQAPEDQAGETIEIHNDRIPAPPPAPPEPETRGPDTYGPGVAPPEPPEETGLTPKDIEVQKEQLCERGRYLLEVLVPRPRAVLVAPDGSVQAVSDQQRQAYLEEGERLVSRYCPDA